MKTIKLKIIKVIPGYEIGSGTCVQADKFGTPLNKFWRDRLHDSKTDGCVEIVTDKKPKKQEPLK